MNPERAQSFLKPEHQQRILKTFRAFSAEAGFSEVATAKQIVANGANLSTPLDMRRQILTTSTDGTGWSSKRVGGSGAKRPIRAKKMAFTTNKLAR